MLSSMRLHRTALSFSRYGISRIINFSTQSLRRTPRTCGPLRSFSSQVARTQYFHVYDGRHNGPKSDLPIIFKAGNFHVPNVAAQIANPKFKTEKAGCVIPPIWLRDHCKCSECFHPSTKQRLIETFDAIPSDIGIVEDSVVETEQGFQITFTDSHQSYYDRKWLISALQKDEGRILERQGVVKPTYWTGETIRSNPPTVDFEAVMASDTGLTEWLRLIREYGFCYVDNCPNTPEDSEKLIERIAFIRPTHYGGFYDFTADLSKGDTAYTQLGIGPHTDNTYFTDPAGLQLFHLLSHADGEGGVSQLVDGFAAAKILHDEDWNAYQTLSKCRVYSHASGNEDSSIQPLQAYPTLIHDPSLKHLVQVRWNTTDRASVDVSPFQLQKWYDAARKWAEILKRIEYWEPLRPGKALIFDNWRVLHGRSAFTGKRRMCGGYVNRDDFISRFKMTNLGREEVLHQVE